MLEAQKNKIFALIDCDNFFVSCERVFNPSLEKQPVIVLSNNDGCAVSRSNEVKKLGIKMGTPIFKIMDLVEKNNIQVFSSNFVLYGDMSHRVMTVLMELFPNVEIYSIDEAFVELTNMYVNDYWELGIEIRRLVKQYTGIPVSVGIARTKTLAKAASEIAKKHSQYKGCVDLVDKPDIDNMLELLPVKDVWGVGRSHTKWLLENNVVNGRQLKYFDKQVIKNKMTVIGERTIMELNGISCIPSGQGPRSPKSMIHTRSFGNYVESYDDLADIVSNFTAQVAEKLRSHHQKVNFLEVYIRTNPNNERQPQYSKLAAVKLPQPSSYTPDLIRYAKAGLKSIFKPGYKYKKAGVMFFGLQPEGEVQMDLLGIYNYGNEKRNGKIMRAVDDMNAKMGDCTIKFAAEGLRQKWHMNQNHKSLRYTTNINEILTIK